MRKSSNIDLYYAPGACSLAGHVALEEAGAKFEAIRLNLASGEQREPDYLSINPRGRVPTLVADGQVITENIAVLTYISSAFPDSGLLPLERPKILARAYELMSWFASGLHVMIAQIWRTERFTAEPSVAPVLQRDARRSIETGYREIEAISGGEWMLGDHYSVVDPYALVFWRWGERLGLDMNAEFPSWASHTRRVLARDAVIRALARESQPQTVSNAAFKR